MNDNTIMTFGAHKGKALANVPNDYLVWLYDNNKAFGQLKKYIEENVPLIMAQMRAKNRNK